MTASVPALRLSFADFTGAALNSLSWYDLPADAALRIDDVPPFPVALDADLSTLPDARFLAQAQVLSARLLMGEMPFLGLEDLRRLAFQTSQVMSRELCTTGNRALRMWAQRLNYALQPLICAGEPPADLSCLLDETVLDGSKPWDALTQDGALVWITSDAKNLHLRRGDETRHLALDLPTQLDPLADGVLSVGSLYSNGATLLQPDLSVNHIVHDAPVLSVFEADGTRLMIDFQGRICEADSGRLHHPAPCQQVHFARVFGQTAYLLDNGDFGHVTLVDLSTGRSNRQPVLPVQVCNDIAVTERGAYLIDKQQGSVFAFDPDWRFREARLSFGKARGQLADPVSLRATDRGLAIVSWLSAKRTEIAFF